MTVWPFDGGVEAPPRPRVREWMHARWRAGAEARERRDDRHCDAVIVGREQRAARELRLELVWRFRAACERPALQLGHIVSTPLGGIVQGRLPRVVDVEVDITGAVPTRLLIELPPGLIVEDLRAVNEELASALGCHRLEFARRVGPGALVEVTLIAKDPHAAVIREVEVVNDSLTLGVDESGRPVRFPMTSLIHFAVQGASGNGKTSATYHALRQLVRMDGVRIAGLDPSAIIFRPLPSDRWRVSGLGDPHRAVQVLADLVAELDRRTAVMPADDDRLRCGPGTDHPYVIAILEELPGLLSHLDDVDRKLGARARALIGRLFAEGRKVSVIVWANAQRFDSTSTAGANARNNAGIRVSFAVENRSAIEMLHEGCSPDTAAEHVHAPPGIALVSSPGAPLRRVRFPLTSYKQWAAAASAATSSGPRLRAVQ